MPEDPMDALLRSVLARHSRPRLAQGLPATVLRRVAERERERRERERLAGARVLLAAYWAASAAASAWILARVPWAPWATELAWGLAMAAVPASFALALFRERAEVVRH